VSTLLAWATAAALTIIIETPILIVAGYRTRIFIAVCVLVNLASNLTLNMGLSLSGDWYWYALYPAEVVVVIVEWAVLRLVADKGLSIPAISWPSAKLAFFVFLANLTSFSLGMLTWALT